MDEAERQEKEQGYERREVQGGVKSEKLRRLILKNMKHVHKLRSGEAVEDSSMLIFIVQIIVLLQELIFIDNQIIYSDAITNTLRHIFSKFLTGEAWITPVLVPIILDVYLVLLLCKLLFPLLLLFLPSSSNVFKYSLRLIATSHSFERTCLAIPIQYFIVTDIISRGAPAILIAIVLIALFTLHALMMNVFFYEYKFLQTSVMLYPSHFQSYLQFILNFILLLIKLFITNQSEKSNTYITTLVIVSLFIVNRLVISYFFVAKQWYNSSGSQKLVFSVKLSIHITLALYVFISSLNEVVYGILNIEVLIFSVFILIIKMYTNLIEIYKNTILETDIYLLDDEYKVEMKLRYLFEQNSQVNESSNETSVEMQRQMALHINQCKEPWCFCRILLHKYHVKWYDTYDLQKSLEEGFREKFKFESNLGKTVHFEQSKTVKEILEEEQKIDETIERKTHKEYLKRRLEKAKSNKRSLQYQSKEAERNESKANLREIVHVINTRSFHFNAVIYSFLLGITNKFQSLELKFILFAFSYHVLKNFTAVITRGYILLYSLHFQKTAGILDLVKLINYLEMAREGLQNYTSSSEGKFSSDNFVTVFETVKKIDKAERLLERIKRERLTFLESLRNQETISKLVNEGEKVYLSQAEFEAISSEVMSQTSGNMKIIQLMMDYRKNVSEDMRGMSNLRELLHKLSKQQRVHIATTFSSTEDRSWNVYDSNNVIVLCKIKNNCPIVTYHSLAAPAYFATTSEQIIGSNIKRFMPSTISAVHDQLVLNYINRKDERNLKTLTVTSFVIDNNQDIKHVHIISKLDVMVNDDIFLVGIICRMNTSTEDSSIIFDKGLVPSHFSENLTIAFPSLIKNEISIFSRIPVLIDIAKKTISPFLFKLVGKTVNSIPNGRGDDLLEEDSLGSKTIAKSTYQSVVLISREPEDQTQERRVQSSRTQEYKQRMLSKTSRYTDRQSRQAVQNHDKDITIEDLKENLREYIRTIAISSKKEEYLKECTVSVFTITYSCGIRLVLVEVRAFRLLKPSVSRDALTWIIENNNKPSLIYLLCLELNLFRKACSPLI